jgi:hypothetical protein
MLDPFTVLDPYARFVAAAIGDVTEPAASGSWSAVGWGPGPAARIVDGVRSGVRLIRLQPAGHAETTG